MDKKTYEALKLIVYDMKHEAKENYADTHKIHEAIKQVEGWIDEYSKEIE